MRKLLVAAMAVGMAGVAFADKPAATKEEKISGEVLDLACYIDHKAQGAKHAKCAAQCLQGGMPPGLLADGKVYLVTGANHENAGATLAQYAGQKVTLTGHAVELPGGGHAFEMTSVMPEK